jgi:hypothetical protein
MLPTQLISHLASSYPRIIPNIENRNDQKIATNGLGPTGKQCGFFVGKGGNMLLEVVVLERYSEYQVEPAYTHTPTPTRSMGCSLPKKSFINTRIVRSLKFGVRIRDRSHYKSKSSQSHVEDLLRRVVESQSINKITSRLFRSHSLPKFQIWHQALPDNCMIPWVVQSGLVLTPRQ